MRSPPVGLLFGVITLSCSTFASCASVAEPSPVTAPEGEPAVHAPEPTCVGEPNEACLGLGRQQPADPALPLALAQSVIGGPLATCSTSPMTGWYRDGSCRTDAQDRGVHVVCASVTEAFLTFSKSRGNDLTRPSRSGRFPGLKPGDKWCLCAARWEEANRAGLAPPVKLDATHHAALRVTSFTDLSRHALSAASN